MSRALRLAACAVVAASLATPGSVPAQSESVVYGKMRVVAPERTDAGDWYGTWYYISRARKVALWIREFQGKPRLRLRLQAAAGLAETFTTDWNATADYTVEGRKGSFRLEFDQRDENTISGTWNWALSSAHGALVETADFTMYRADWGRHLVLRLTDLSRERRGSAKGNRAAMDQVWSFRKASRREVLWGELPF